MNISLISLRLELLIFICCCDVASSPRDDFGIMGGYAQVQLVHECDLTLLYKVFLNKTCAVDIELKESVPA